MAATLVALPAPDAHAEAGDCVHLEVHSLGGEKLLSEALPLSISVGDLAARLGGGGTVRQAFVGAGFVLADPKAALGEALSPGRASLTLVREDYPRVSYRGLVGGHTDNPAYFRRDAELDCLRLVRVCWFEVGGTLRSVPAGAYRVVVEAACGQPFRLGGKAFDVAVKGRAAAGGHWEHLAAARWDAEPELREEFQEFEIAQVELSRGCDVHVLLDQRNTDWIQGFLWRSLSLHML